MKLLPTQQSLHSVFTRLLWVQFFMPILLVSLGGVFLAAYLGGRSFHDQEMKLTHTMSYAVSEYLTSAIDVLQTLTDHANFDNLDDLTLSLDLVQRGLNSFDAFYLLDPQGIVKVIVPANPNMLGLDWSGQHFFSDSLTSPSVTVSRPFISVRNGQPAVILSKRLPDGGVLAGELNLHELQRITNSAGVQGMRASEIFVTDGLGTLLAYPDESRVARQENVGSLQIVKDARQHETTLVYWYQGTLYLGGGMHIPSSNWVIVTQTSFFEIYFPYYGPALLMLLFLLLVLAVFVRLLFARLQHLLMLPLGQLSTFTGQMAAGQAGAGANLKNVPQTFREMGQLVRGFSQMSEAVERRTSELKELARIDQLTGLSNRAYFREQVSNLIKTFSNANSHFALLFVDLDNFKSVNDAFGHTSGDQVLRHIAHLLNRPRPERLLAGRLGGDEFALVQRVRYTREAALLAGDLLAELNQPMQIGSHQVYISPSIGISFFPEDGDQPDLLIQKADTAMYMAKREGKNGFQIYSLEMETQAQERHAYTTHLHHALEFKEFSLLYQPIIQTCTRQRAGFEALLRWNNPRLGNVSPEKFVPLANDSGLILPIGEWIIQSACQQAVQWNQNSLQPVWVSVNVTERQLRYKGFGPALERVLETTRLPAHLLCLELNESIVFQNFTEINQILNEIKRLGVRLSLDDFGTGYSTLSCLTQIPFDEIKIDRSLTNQVVHSPRQAAIVNGVLSISKNLGIEVVAEGVETEEQIEYYANLQCDLLQGFYFSRPQPPSAFKSK